MSFLDFQQKLVSINLSVNKSEQSYLVMYCEFILLIYSTEDSLLKVKLLSSRRFIRILLLPILALIFLFGWLMYSISGGDRTRVKKKPSEKTKPYDLEIGAINETEPEATLQVFHRPAKKQITPEE